MEEFVLDTNNIPYILYYDEGRTNIAKLEGNDRILVGDPIDDE